MQIRRGELVGSVETEEMVNYCLSDLQENGFVDGVDWDTKISENVTVEELIGALVAAEADWSGQAIDYEHDEPEGYING